MFDMGRVSLGVEASMTYSVILTRSLWVKSKLREGVVDRVTLEIGVPQNAEGDEPIEAQAGFRVSPLTDWKQIFGVDAIQAVYYAIQIGEQEAMRLGADWLDDGSED